VRAALPQSAVDEVIDDSRVEPCNLGNVRRRTLSLRKSALQIHGKYLGVLSISKASVI
jgi:hypothetical protein